MLGQELFDGCTLIYGWVQRQGNYRLHAGEAAFVRELLYSAR
jgi:hypothetical protein